MTLLRPTEVLEQHPEVKKHFNEKQIGYLFWLNIVRGKKLRRTCEVAVEDVLKVVALKESIA